MNNNINRNQFDILDFLSIIGFYISVLNYAENLSQGDIQDIVKSGVDDIHKHLEMQDAKLDKIMNILGGEIE